MSSSPPTFSIALSHAKHLFEIQAIQLQIKNQAIFSSGPVSLHSWCHSQLQFLPCLRFKCNLLPTLCLFPLLDLLSQGIIPPCLQSITGFGSGHHCPSPFSVQQLQKASCCSRHPKESDQNQALPACMIYLTMQGQVSLLAHWHLVIDVFPFALSGLVWVVDVNSWHCSFT